MAQKQSWGDFPPYIKASLPAFPGLTFVLRPGVIFRALAQGRGELIWGSYIIAKYGLTFPFLLLPACLLQSLIAYELGRYTMLTGESIFQGYIIRLNRYFAQVPWVPDPVLSLVWCPL